MSSTDSAVVTCSLYMEGVWLHDPADPAGTARNFRYGRSLRSSAMGVSVDLLYYAGREFPVADFGPNATDTAAVRVDVPFGPTWSADLSALRALVQLRRPLTFRDNRGRWITGTIASVQETDHDAGTQVAFSVDRVDA